MDRSGTIGRQSLQQQLDATADDYDNLCRLIVSFQISTGSKFPRNPQEARTAIQQHIDTMARSFYDINERMVKRSKGMIDSLKRCREHQLTCRRFYDDSSREVRQLNQLTTCQLNIYRPRFLELFQERSTRLKDGRIKILILGEISAGKSSVLNLWMGGQYFPVGHGHCTRIPCEVRNSSERIAYLYYDEEQWAEAAEYFELSTNPEDDCWVRVQKCLLHGFDQMNENKAYYSRPLHKIVISWPLVLFQNHFDCDRNQTKVMKLAMSPKLDTEHEAEPNKTTIYSRNGQTEASDTGAMTEELINNMTFVDAPGIYDTDESFINLQSLIQDSDAFVFVISIAENGGVAKDRVIKLMQLVQQIYEEKNKHFNPRCALFLCNKWDLLEDEYKEDIEDNILKKLRECWPMISSKQLFPVSASKQTLRQIQDGSIPNIYEKFYYGVCTFIEDATCISIESNCWWLTSFLDKVITIQKNAAQILDFARKQKKDVVNNLKEVKRSMINMLEFHKQKQQKIKEEENKAVDSLQERIKQVLTTKLQSLCCWSDSDIPARDNGLQWKYYQHELNRQIAIRLEEVLLNDDEVNPILDLFESNIKQELHSLRYLLSKKDRNMVMFQPFTASIDLPVENAGIMSNSKYAFLVLGVIVTLPIAPFLIILWHLFEEFTVPVLQDDEQLFNRDPKEYMTKQTSIFIDKVLKEKLLNIAHTRLEALSSNAKHMMQFFYACVENRLNGIDAMLRQVEGETIVQENHDRLGEITKELSQFYVSKIMKHEIHSDMLTVDIENPAKLIGEVSLNSYVIKGEYFDEQANKVAVKVVKWPLGEEEAIFRECLLLRQLSQKPEDEKSNFVKFFGSTYEVSEHTFKLMLVCELCDTDLSKIIKMDKLIQATGSELDFPGNDPMKGRGWNYCFDLSTQAANGLKFIHKNGIIHRDVKPSNFLVKFINNKTVVKIADVGFSRQVALNATIQPGTILYSAPEVLLESLHSFKSDVYSLALVFYELWYGQMIPMKKREGTSLAFTIAQPELHDTYPPPKLKQLLKSAWKQHPAERPHVSQILSCFSELANDYRY